MDQTIAALLGAIIGAVAAIVGTVLTSLFQSRSERRKWFRDLNKQVYSDTLNILSKTLVVPIGMDMDRLEQWYRDLAILRENLVSLQIYCDQRNESLNDSISELFNQMDINDFVIVATEGKTFREEQGAIVDISVLLGVARIRSELKKVLDRVTESATQMLGRAIVVDAS